MSGFPKVDMEEIAVYLKNKVIIPSIVQSSFSQSLAYFDSVSLSFFLLLFIYRSIDISLYGENTWHFNVNMTISAML